MSHSSRFCAALFCAPKHRRVAGELAETPSKSVTEGAKGARKNSKNGPQDHGTSEDEDDEDLSSWQPDTALNADDDDDDDALWQKYAPQAVVTEETQQQATLRQETMSKYAKTVLQGEHEGEEFAQGFSNRSEHSPVADSSRSEEAQNRRVQDAQTLQDLFFLAQEGDKDAAKTLNQGTQLSVDDHHRFTLSQNRQQEGQIDADDAEEFNHALLEQSIEASLRDLADRTGMRAGPKGQALEHDRDAINVINKRLTNEQSDMLRTARRECKHLVPQLREHIRKVSKELDQKLSEDFDHNNYVPRHLSSHLSRHKSRVDLTPAGRAEKASFEAAVGKLKKELALLHRHLSQIRIEQHFPRCMRWKLKVDAGDGTFIGIRDMEVGAIQAKFHASTLPSKPGRIRIEVKDIIANLGLLELSIRGANTKARILGGLLTPTINRLDLDVRGSWVLELKFEANKQQAHWEEVKENSTFQLTLSRKVTGLTPIRLPQSFLQSITKMLLPKIISGALRNILPVQLGLLLLETDNTVSIQGNVDIKGDMSPKTWREPLIAPTAAGSHARATLGISQKEAYMLDFLCRGPRAAAAGFKNKAISLARLFRWRLRYATYRLSELEEMLDLVQRDASVVLPPGWLTQILRFVSQLAKKPFNIRLSVSSIQTDLNLSQAVEAGLDMYLSSFRQAMNMTHAQKARVVARARYEEAQLRVATITKLMHTFIVPIINPSIELDLTGLFIGGLHTGFGLGAIHRVIANLKLPPHFLFRPTLRQKMKKNDRIVEIEGNLGPREDEYTVIVRMDSLDGEASISLRDVRLDMFRSSADPGGITLQAKEVRASMLLNMIDQLLGEISHRVEQSEQEQQQQQQQQQQFNGESATSDPHEDEQSPNIHTTYVFPETRELIEHAEAVLGVSRAFDNEEEGDSEDPNDSSIPDSVHEGFLPYFILDDTNDLRCDVQNIHAVVLKVHDGRRNMDTLRLRLHAEETLAIHFSVRANMRDIFDLYR